MSDVKIFTFHYKDGEYDSQEKIESRGYKKAVKSFQSKYPKIKDVEVIWNKDKIELNKLQKLPMGRFKKVGK